jgi:hypothetical protein
MSGDYSGPCCCGSVTRLKGGIHPDAIRHATVDMKLEVADGTSFDNYVLTNEPGHLISVTAGMVAININTAGGSEHQQIKALGSTTATDIYSQHAVSFSLFTLPAFVSSDMQKGGFSPATAYEDGRVYLATGAVSTRSTHWSLPPDLFGLFFDGALFVEFNGLYNYSGMAVRLTANYVPRAQFSPAYPDPVGVLQHYWKCGHGDEEFLDGFYGGNFFDVDSSAAVSGPPSDLQSSRGTNPGLPINSFNTRLTW